MNRQKRGERRKIEKQYIKKTGKQEYICRIKYKEEI